MEKEVYRCPICGQVIKKGNGWHTNQCITNYVASLSKERIDELIHLYNDEGYSMVDMTKVLGFPYQLTERILKRIGLNRRSVSAATSLGRCREKYKQTCLEHFGTEHNFSKECPSRKEWEKRLLDEEGITNVFQRESVKKQIKETMLERYGEDGWLENRRKGNFVEFYIEKYGEEEGRKYFEWVQMRKRMAGSKEMYQEKYGDEWEEKWMEHQKRVSDAFVARNYTGLNDKCEAILVKHKIKFTREYPLSYDGVDHFYYYDFKIGNILLELNGTYWHCTPKKYKPNDLVRFPNGEFVRAKDKWAHDVHKAKIAKDHGYVPLTIWEDEFNEETLLNLLNQHTNEWYKNQEGDEVGPQVGPIRLNS